MNVTGILLCGGASRRMGRDKSGLTLGGRTFLELQAEKLRAAGADEILLSGGSADLPGAVLVPDEYPGRGPLGGLHACLKAAKHHNCLVLTVDTPLVPGDALQGLVEAHLAGSVDVTLLADEPLIAVYRSGLVPWIEGLILEGPAPVKTLLEQVETASVPFGGDPALLKNCNTPEDYREICRFGEEKS